MGKWHWRIGAVLVALIAIMLVKVPVGNENFQRQPIISNVTGSVISPVDVTTNSSSLGIPNSNSTVNGVITDNTNKTQNTTQNTTKSIVKKPDTSVQVIHMDVTDSEYIPSELYAHAGRPIRLIINGSQATTCTQEIMFSSLGFNKTLGPGDTIIDLPPLKNGTYDFHCGMKMVWGSLTAY